MRTVLGGLVLAGLAAAAVNAPAAATVSIDTFASYSFNLATGTSYSASTDGFKFTTTGTGTDASKTKITDVGYKTLGVTASAWNITASGSNYVVAKASGGIEQYDGGLGVKSGAYDTLSHVVNGQTSYSWDVKATVNGQPYYTNLDCSVSGNCNTHQVDNQGTTLGSKSMDVVQLVFDRAVILNNVGTNAFGLISGNTVTYNNKPYNTLQYDDDFTYGKGTALTAGTINQTAYNALWNPDYKGDNGGCTPNNIIDYLAVCSVSTTVNATGDKSLASNVWYISAGAALSNQSGADAIADAFKLNQISVFEYVKTYVFAPEPSTWAMMVLGFGAVGTSIRRRKAEERKAAAAA